MMAYSPRDWFWIIGGDESRAWSSALGAYVTEYPDDRLTRILNEAELTDVLKAYGLPGPVVTVDDVTTERARRLALGFDHDFGDERGVHRIGTTDADMRGWDEVAKGSQAAINLGAPGALLDIVTDTGPVQVTALEFQQILAAATVARQPIWAASFVLQGMSPIPTDYADAGYWPAGP
jgi:hypothetical protein